MKHAAAVAELLSYQAYMVRIRSSRSFYCMYACYPTNLSVRLSVQKETVPLYKKQILQLRSQLTAATGARPSHTPMHCFQPDLT